MFCCRVIFYIGWWIRGVMICLVLSSRVVIVQLYIRTLHQSRHCCIVDRCIKIEYMFNCLLLLAFHAWHDDCQNVYCWHWVVVSGNCLEKKTSKYSLPVYLECFDVVGCAPRMASGMWKVLFQQFLKVHSGASVMWKIEPVKQKTENS